MYNDDVTRTPVNKEEMWDVLREQFAFVEHVLCDYYFETKEDALANRYRKDGEKGAMMLIKYRNVHPDYDNRKYYFDMGRELLPLVAQLLDARKLTPEFVQAWGMIMYCHGYMAAHIFDDSDDLQPVRAGSRPKREIQRRWVAATMLEFIDEGLNRRQAEERTAARAREFIASGKFPPGFDKQSFKAILRDGHDLTTSYSRNHLSITKMREIVGARPG